MTGTRYGLTFYTTVTKRLKLKLRKLKELIPTFVKVTWEKLEEGVVFLVPGLALVLGKSM